MGKSNPKLNDGCIKIFKFLDLLYKDQAYYANVIDLFKDEIENNDPKTVKNTQVILNKYLNTLKVFGIKVQKEKGKFRISNSCYSINFSSDDIRVIKLLADAAKSIPDEKLNDEIAEFVETLKFIMDSSSKNKLDSITNNQDFSFQYADIKEQFDKCKRICEERHNVGITFNKNNSKLTYKCTPKEVVYSKNNVYLSVYVPSLRENLEIPVKDILSIDILPNLSSSIEMTMTVVYKLKGRLAKGYRLKEFEHSEGFDKNGDLIVINKGEPTDKLLSRLMRYMYNCEIISPKSLRLKIEKMIDNTLKQYEE